MAEKQDAATLAQDIARRTEVSATTSPTPAGPTEASETLDSQLIETINQIFALFRLNYHNQYYAAWSDAEQVKQVKRLWLDALETYPTAVILRAAQHAIERSDYLPTLNRMIEACRHCLSDLGLPSLMKPTARHALRHRLKMGLPGRMRRSIWRGATAIGFSSPTNLKIKAGRFIVSTTSDGSAGRLKGRYWKGPSGCRSHPLMTARLAQRSNPPIWRGCEEKSGCKRFARQPAIDHASMASRTLWA